MALTASKMCCVEHVDADQRQVAGRVARLFDQADDAARVGPARPRRTAAGCRPRVSTIWLFQSLVANWRIRPEMPPWITLSPRNMTKRSSPRKSWLILTAWARPSGASWGM